MSAEAPWSFRMPPPTVIKFFAVSRGTCWLIIEEDGDSSFHSEPIKLAEGDALLYSMKRNYTLCSDPSVPPVDVDKSQIPDTTRIQIGSGKDFEMVGCHAYLDRTSGFSIADVLPELIHIKSNSKQAPILKWLLDQLVQERASGLPGSTAASAQLAHLVFIQILRAYLDSAEPISAGWLRAMSDQRLQPALRLMHNEPGRNWTLAELAKEATMSRTTFAEHFKNVAGVAPLTYLTEWRMRLAENALRADSASVSALADSLGYSSVSAFSNAFKRVVGVAPQRVRGKEIESPAMRYFSHDEPVETLTRMA